MLLGVCKFSHRNVTVCFYKILDHGCEGNTSPGGGLRPTAVSFGWSEGVILHVLLCLGTPGGCFLL